MPRISPASRRRLVSSVSSAARCGIPRRVVMRENHGRGGGVNRWPKDLARVTKGCRQRPDRDHAAAVRLHAVLRIQKQRDEDLLVEASDHRPEERGDLVVRPTYVLFYMK